MDTGEKTAVFDRTLQIEGYRFRGLAQPFPTHFHGHYVLGLVERGVRELACKGRTWTLRPGCLMLLNPGESHACVQREGTLYYRSVHIPIESMLALARGLTAEGTLPVFPSPVAESVPLAEQFRTFHRRLMAGDSPAAEEALVLFLSAAPDPAPAAPPEPCPGEVEAVRALLEAHFSQRITLDRLCRRTGLSTSTLLRAFTREMGITPYRYLETLRVNAAKALLEQGVPPLEAALRTGFADQSHFTNSAASACRRGCIRKSETEEETMDLQTEKCVIVADGALPPGLVANTAAILGVTLGKNLPEAVGPDVADGSGVLHPGIIAFPVPILRGDRESLRALREKLRMPSFSGLFAADFSDLAQGCRTYGEFQEKLAAAPEDSLRYLGIAVCGEKKLVNRLTGNLPLLR